MTLAEFGSTKEADQAQIAGKVMYSLSRDAMFLAMEIGREKLLGTTGIHLLAGAIRDRIFPSKQAGARKLFRQGQRPDGHVARAAADALTQHISRRRRWWNMLTSLGDGIVLSSSLLGGLVLDLAGFNQMECSTGNDTGLEKIAQASFDQHSDVHNRREFEPGSQVSMPASGVGRGRSTRGYIGGPQRQTNMIPMGRSTCWSPRTPRTQIAPLSKTKPSAKQGLPSSMSQNSWRKNDPKERGGGRIAANKARVSSHPFHRVKRCRWQRCSSKSGSGRPRSSLGRAGFRSSGPCFRLAPRPKGFRPTCTRVPKA